MSLEPQQPNNQSSLDTWLDWLLHIHTQEIDLGLERIRVVAERLGLLQPESFVITVAGTNGKGSTVAMLHSTFLAAGYKVGSYTSPHIHQFNERIKIGNRLASDQEIIDAFCAIDDAREDITLTFFEFGTLAGLYLFAQEKLNFVILEVGLGGRLDAVNIIDANAAIITAIDVDHIDWLGDDRGQIALEKAGVLRKEQLAICSDPTVPETLKKYAKTLGTKIDYLASDFTYSTPQGGCCDAVWQLEYHNDSLLLPLPALKGDFQVQNASGVVALMLKMKAEGLVDLAMSDIEKGLLLAVNPGRLQWVNVNDQAKQVLFDVAHNPQSAGVLADYLSANELSNLPCVFSVLADKDASEMIQVLKPHVSVWLIFTLSNPRAQKSENIENLLLNCGVAADRIVVLPDSLSAVKQLLDSAQEIVLCCGSFFTVAEVQAQMMELGYIDGAN